MGILVMRLLKSPMITHQLNKTGIKAKDLNLMVLRPQRDHNDQKIAKWLYQSSLISNKLLQVRINLEQKERWI